MSSTPLGSINYFANEDTGSFPTHKSRWSKLCDWVKINQKKSIILVTIGIIATAAFAALGPIALLGGATTGVYIIAYTLGFSVAISTKIATFMLLSSLVEAYNAT